MAVDLCHIFTCISGRSFHVNGQHFVDNVPAFRVRDFAIGHPAAYYMAFAHKDAAEDIQRFRSADPYDSDPAFAVGC